MIRWRRATERHWVRAGGQAARRVWRRQLLVLAITAAVLSSGGAGCSTRSGDPASSGSDQAEEELGTIVCGTYTIPNARRGTSERLEYYRLWSINRTLRYLPEFASTIGTRSVKTCDEARAYMRAYKSYFAAHPYFDRRIPLPDAPPLDALLDDDPGAVVPKIFNGTTTGRAGDDFHPVVEVQVFLKGNAKLFNGQPIFPDPGGKPEGALGPCTGTFVAKNFILTAAHCFPELALQYDPRRPGSKEWITWGDFTIDWPDATGHLGTDLVDRQLAIRAVISTHPSYAGRGPAILEGGLTIDDGAPYDISLIYVPGLANDGVLPADPDRSAWPVQLEELDAILPGWSDLTAWGYGGTDGAEANLHVLNAKDGPPQPPSLTGLEVVNSGLVQQITEDSWPGWALCNGDSGGPLTRAINTSTGPQTIIIGVASSGGDEEACSAHRGDKFTWSRVDLVSDWLLDTVKRNLGVTAFTPQIFTDDSASPPRANSYMKLYGKVCTRDCECGAREICYDSLKDPGSPFYRGHTSCSGCPSCECKRGQCSPVLGPFLPDANAPVCQ